MTTLLIILHVFVSLFLILVVLLQTGQADMGTSFGGSSSSLLGTGGNKFMTRLTSIAAAIFMFTSIALTVMGTGSSAGDLDLPEDEPAAVETTAPAAGEAPAPEGEKGVDGEKTAAAKTDEGAKDAAAEEGDAARPATAPAEKAAPAAEGEKKE